MSDVTNILNSLEDGTTKQSERLFQLVYDELRLLAAQKLAHERPGQTLQATALVHEAYLKLVGPDNEGDRSWRNRGHFFRTAAAAMQQILVDNARRKQAVKHGEGVNRVPLQEADVAVTKTPSIDLVALDETLTWFAQEAPVHCELVKLRYFGGLTQKQAAEAMGVSRSTADRYWTYARAWLVAELNDPDDPASC